MTISIVLADDHRVVRDGVKLLLGMQPDLKVIGEAADGREAVAMVKKLNPDVLLLDLTMPNMNGLEALHNISDLSVKTRAIILSMNADSEHIFQAFRAGARGYLLKTSAGEEIIEAIRATRRNEYYLSSTLAEFMPDINRLSDEKDWVNPLESLSPREREVLQLVVEGKSSVEIARQLHLSDDTVRTYRKRINQKLNIKDLPSLVKFAILHGITPLHTTQK